MECRYVAAYKVQGFSNTPALPDVPLVVPQDLNMRATFTSDADGHCYVLDRKSALQWMMSMGQLNAENVDESLDETIQEVRKNRNQNLRLKISGALVIEFWEEVEATLAESDGDFGEFAVYSDAINVDEVTESFRDRAAALISSLAISSATPYAFERMTDGTYLVNDDGKVIYTFTTHAGESSILHLGTLEVLDLNPAYVSALIRNTKMRSISTLLAQSLHVSTDRFRTFLFAWTALEILINKAFSLYEQDLINELTAKSTVPTIRYFERIKDVMGDKYRLVDKFSVIASFLAGESRDEHIEQFKRIKDIRDSIIHKGDFKEESLPNLELRELLTEYLRRHLDYISP